MRAKRTERKKTVSRVRITLRVKTLLYALWEMKFLRTSQIAMLCFGRLTSTARLWLRKLLDAELIRAWVSSLNEENLYSLDRKGLAILMSERSWEGTPPSIPRRLERRIDHLSDINDFRVGLALALRARGGAIVAWLPE